MAYFDALLLAMRREYSVRKEPTYESYRRHIEFVQQVRRHFGQLWRRCKNSQPSPTLGTLSTFNQPSFP